MDNISEQAPTQPVRTLRIFGVGVAGIRIVDRLLARGMPGAETVAIATDTATLASSTAHTKCLLESKRLRGLGTGGDPIRGARVADENLSEIESLCEGAELVFVVAGLGGGTGTGISPVIARAARQAGALVIGFAVLPFECEGETRGLNASRGLEAFKAAADGVVCLPNEKLLKLIGERCRVTEAFETSAGLMVEGLLAVWRLIHLKGPIELNFEDLNSVLKDRHAECLFAVAEASGPDRVEDTLKQLLTHPLLSQGGDLERADAVLVSVISGNELGMVEVNRLMKGLNERCSRARVCVGVGVSDAVGDRLMVAVIAACRGCRLVGSKTGPAKGAQGDRSGSVADEESDELYPRLLPPGKEQGRTRARYVPPPPDLAPDRLQESAPPRSGRRSGNGRLRQEQLPLEVVSRGRFEKGERTILRGEDLDVPTYVRRGVALN